jgi:hypothetical protein
VYPASVAVGKPSLVLKASLPAKPLLVRILYHVVLTNKPIIGCHRTCEWPEANMSDAPKRPRGLKRSTQASEEAADSMVANQLITFSVCILLKYLYVGQGMICTKIAWF